MCTHVLYFLIFLATIFIPIQLKLFVPITGISLLSEWVSSSFTFHQQLMSYVTSHEILGPNEVPGRN